MNANHKILPDPACILGRAVLETSEFFGLSAEILGKVLGRDRTSITRLKKNPTIDPKSKTGELALLLIRVYRGLFAILGGNQSAIKEWLRQNNLALHGQPITQIQSIMGLTSTVQYIDAMRGKI
jgi:hypothetical protein